MQGYWKAPEETANALRNGWLYSGDIGHVDADGYTYTGIDTNAYADTDANTLGYAYPNAFRDANSDSDANAGAEPGSVQRLELQRK